jgi:hypothetical protein
VLIPKRFRRDVMSAKTYPGADVKSDHNPVVVEIRIHFRKAHKPSPAKRVDVRRLAQDKDLQGKVVAELKKTVNDSRSDRTAEQTWERWKMAQEAIQEKLIGRKPFVKKKPWMKEEILQLMEERRRNKGKKAEYTRLHKIIRRKIREAKEEWLEENCKEIEELQKKHDYFNVHRKVKEFLGLNKRSEG